MYYFCLLLTTCTLLSAVYRQLEALDLMVSAGLQDYSPDWAHFVVFWEGYFPLTCRVSLQPISYSWLPHSTETLLTGVNCFSLDWNYHCR